jgi:hypothetical protein
MRDSKLYATPIKESGRIVLSDEYSVRVVPRPLWPAVKKFFWWGSDEENEMKYPSYTGMFYHGNRNDHLVFWIFMMWNLPEEYGGEC